MNLDSHHTVHALPKYRKLSFILIMTQR